MSQDFMIRSGIQMNVVGADKVLDALRTLEKQIMATGATSTRTMNRMAREANVYFSAMEQTHAAQRQLLGQTPVAARTGARGDVVKDEKQMADAAERELKRVTAAYNQNQAQQAAALRRQSAALKQHQQEVTQTLTYLGVALSAFGVKVTQTALELTKTAARAEELQVAMRNMAEVLGYNVQAIDQYEEAIKGLNIRTDAAREALLLFMRMNLDVAQSTKLARIAQDAAVISMEDSSDALEGILHGIMTLQPRVLRTHGIIVNLDMAYKDYAYSMGTTAEALTMEQKQEIALQEVIKQGVRLQGIYEAAMTTTAKQMRSVLGREVYETQRAFGEQLIPTLGVAVRAFQKINDFLQGMPSVWQGTISKMIAFTGISAAVTGAMMVMATRASQLSAALSTIGMIRGGAGLAALLPGPTGIALGIAAVAATAVAVITSVREAQKKQAASAIDTANSYHAYMIQMDTATRKNYGLSDSIWKVIEAQREQGVAPTGAAIVMAMDEMAKSFRAFIATAQMGRGGEKDWEEFFAESGSLERFVSGLDELQLQLAADEQQAVLFLRSIGFMGEGINDAAKKLVYYAKAQQVSNRVASDDAKLIEARSWRWREQIPLLTEATIRTNQLIAATDALNQAMAGGMMSRYTGFLGGLAEALTSITDIENELSDLQADFKLEMGKIGADFSKAMNKINDQLSKMVPEATADEARLQMGGDAWDEWARRWKAAQDTTYSAIEGSWLQTTMDMVKNTKWALIEGETVYEWMDRLVTGFYEGDAILVEKFANKQTAAWQWMSIQKKEELDKQTADATAARDEEYAETMVQYKKETALLQEKRNMALLEMSLQLADQSGMLDDWAKEFTAKMVPPGVENKFAAVYGDADLLFKLLESGALTVDELTGLEEKILLPMATGIMGKMDSARKNIDETKGKVLDLYTSATTAAQNAATEAQKNLAWFRQAPKIPGMPMGLAAGMGPTAAVGEELFGQFMPALDAIVDEFPTLSTAAKKAFLSDQGVLGSSNSAASAIMREWLEQSVIPDLRNAFILLGLTVYNVTRVPMLSSLNEVEAKLVSIKNYLVEIDTLLQDEQPYIPPESQDQAQEFDGALLDLIESTKAWGDETSTQVYNVIIPAIQDVIRALAQIPPSVTVDIQIIDPPPGFGKVIMPEDRIQGIIKEMEKIPSTITTDVQMMGPVVGRGGGGGRVGNVVGGDTYVMNITDPRSMAVAQAIVADKQRTRQNLFMGVS